VFCVIAVVSVVIPVHAVVIRDIHIVVHS